MKELSKLTLNQMDGEEILSTKYEGCVFVSGKKVIKAGNVIDTLDTDDKINTLWNELVKNEFGTTNTTSILKMCGDIA